MKKIILSKKDCTKKEWKNFMQARRCPVGLNQNLGTRTHNINHKKDRAKAKKDCSNIEQSFFILYIHFLLFQLDLNI